MPGTIPTAADYDVVVTEELVPDAECGLNSHDPGTINRLIDDLGQRSDNGWEVMTAHRSVLVVHGAPLDPLGHPVRGRIVRHEVAFRRSPPRRKWDYKIDALSDSEDPQVEQMVADRLTAGWQLVGCSRYAFEAVTPGIDDEDLVHRTQDAVLFWKRAAKRPRRRP